MIDLSSPKKNDFDIENESIILYLNDINKVDFEYGIENVANIICNIIGFDNDNIDSDNIEIICSILNDIYSKWNNQIDEEYKFLTINSSINNDILSISSILNEIPINYIDYYLSNNFEYESDSDDSMQYTHEKTESYVLTKDNEYVKTAEYICYLHNLPQKEQKSKEWLEQRQGNITASEVGTIMGITPVSWGNKNKLFTSKCGIADPLSSPALDHGNKFEEVVCQIYQDRVNKKVIEFGMIQHQGGNGIQPIKFFGASPDGITTDGVMLEIKAPWKREMTGQITPYYFSQVQHQMECCNLPYCDFIECKIRDNTLHGGSVYADYEDYLNDCPENIIDKENFVKTKNNLEKGIIFCIKYFDNRIIYKYPGVNLTYNEYLQKFKELENETVKNPEIQMVEKIYWRLEDAYMQRIERDTSWFLRNLNTLNVFWKELKYYKENGVNSILKKNTKTFNNILGSKANVCLID